MVNGSERVRPSRVGQAPEHKGAEFQRTRHVDRYAAAADLWAMGTQGPGRKRLLNLEKLTAEDDALKEIARQAEARLAARRAARAEARDIRMKELERQHKELSDDEERMSVGSRGSLKVEDRLDRDFLDRGSRTALNLSAATLSPLGGASSRRGSCDTSVSVEMEASIREMKDSVAEAEEKYRRAMVSNAQLHNDKSTLMYQVETLREELSDIEEQLWEARRQSDERAKAYERERDSHIVLQFQLKEMKETMRRSEELLMEMSQLREQTRAYSQEVSDLQETLQWKEKKIAALERQREISDVIQIERDQLRVEVLGLRDVLKKSGEVVSPEVATNGGPRLDDAEEEFNNSFASHLAKEAPGSRESMLELHLKKLFEERESFQDQVRMLKTQLLLRQRKGSDGSQNPDEERLENGTDSHGVELQRDASRQISDLKFKLVKSEQEVATLEQNVIRLEGQVTRYRTASESAQMVEDELKVEKRKLQRELRSALDQIQELEATNGLLAKRLEKMKANRSILLAQQ
ncbi:leucine-rich repeat flightless-interacting protein 2 isoform X6 [Syngnathoides biaculeatus]|uniref:leucine-rich repeat flightless-interacting protein 2 isoform X6 n=1 Tax=Syngnathoides biaculeatus TaxID=300417 RepID=UPI002ADDE4ED|nr:leucine-rich repeat flightless-interacting protein 2 isoform X6 [Syngnathoides biaculeatus]